MGVLSGPEIARLVKLRQEAARRGDPVPVPSILIEPFDPELAGPNSYDIHLSPEFKVYALSSVRRIHPDLFRTYPDEILADGIDPKVKTPTVSFEVSPDGFWLQPGVLYLAATVEHTKCDGLVPWLDGRSSVGRMGLSVHVTAGRGDDAWPGRWTLEVTAVTHPVKVYPHMRVGQVTYFQLIGERKPYGGKYADQQGPTESRLYQDADAGGAQ